MFPAFHRIATSESMAAAPLATAKRGPLRWWRAQVRAASWSSFRSRLVSATASRNQDRSAAASGRLVGFHDPDGHELSFYAETHPEGVRSDAVRTVRTTGGAGPTAEAAPAASHAGLG